MHTFSGDPDLDCTPPDDSLCADVEDSLPWPNGMRIYHNYPCKIAYLMYFRFYLRMLKGINIVLFFQTRLISIIKR